MGEASLEQLRIFIAAADEGSFSKAARKLDRVQSAVSQAMGSLEQQLGVSLWDRSARIPVLTEHGRAVLAAARTVCAEADSLRQLVENLGAGVEPEVSLAIDSVFPAAVLAKSCAEFSRRFAGVQLRITTETLSAVSALVRDGTCQLGVIGPDADARGLTREALLTVHMIPVAARNHPLARARGKIPTAEIARHTQIVLSERGDGMGPDHAVLAHRTWRVTDLGLKHALISAGLGWGNLPKHLLNEGLVRLKPADWAPDDNRLSMAIAARRDVALGPAARWLRQSLLETSAPKRRS